jgi:hypothetical protein
MGLAVAVPCCSVLTLLAAHAGCSSSSSSTAEGSSYRHVYVTPQGLLLTGVVLLISVFA